MPEQNSESIQVSVTITTYKHEEFISQCLDSLVSQKTNFPFEILVGVDESGDRTLDICLEYQMRYPYLVKVFLNDSSNVLNVNGRRVGRYNFLNILNKAKGKYIARCDGDDYWTDENKLQLQYDLLESNPDCIACHHWQKYALPDEKGGYIEIAAPTMGHGYLPNRISTVKEIFRNKMRIKTRTLMFRNQFKPLPEWFHKITFGDVALSFVLGEKGKFIFINKEMAVYRQTKTGAASIGIEQPDFILKNNLEWIRLWDYADINFKGSYREDGDKTVRFFYFSIFRKYKYKFKTYVDCLRFSINESPISVWRKAERVILVTFWYVLYKTKHIFDRKMQK